jgi:hypothetical protein
MWTVPDARRLLTRATSLQSLCQSDSRMFGHGRKPDGDGEAAAVAARSCRAGKMLPGLPFGVGIA